MRMKRQFTTFKRVMEHISDFFNNFNVHTKYVLEKEQLKNNSKESYSYTPTLWRVRMAWGARLRMTESRVRNIERWTEGWGERAPWRGGKRPGRINKLSSKDEVMLQLFRFLVGLKVCLDPVSKVQPNTLTPPRRTPTKQWERWEGLCYYSLPLRCLGRSFISGGVRGRARPPSP